MVKNLQVMNQEKTKKGKLTKIFLAGVLVGTFAFGIPKVMEALEKDKIQDELKEEFKDFDSFSTLEVASLNFWLEDEEFAKYYDEHKELAFILAPISQEKLTYAYNQIIDWQKTYAKYINSEIAVETIDNYGFRLDFDSLESAIKNNYLDQSRTMINDNLQKINEEKFNFYVSYGPEKSKREDMDYQLYKIIYENSKESPSATTLEMHPRMFMFKYSTYYRTLSESGIDFRTLELNSEVDIITR